jgi:hypothetical protein
MYFCQIMQPDNEKIIEAIAAHQATTRKLMQDLIGYGATHYTLGALVQTLGILSECYSQPHQACMAQAGAIPMATMGIIRRERGVVSSDLPSELEEIINQAVKEYEPRESSHDD